MQKLIDKTRRIQQEFEKNGSIYDKRSCLIDLMEEVGELAQAVHIVEGFKHTNDPRKKKTKEDVADALSDILFELIRLADLYELDLGNEYQKTLDHLSKRLQDGEFSRQN